MDDDGLSPSTLARRSGEEHLSALPSAHVQQHFEQLNTVRKLLHLLFQQADQLAPSVLAGRVHDVLKVKKFIWYWSRNCCRKSLILQPFPVPQQLTCKTRTRTSCRAGLSWSILASSDLWKSVSPFMKNSNRCFSCLFGNS